MIDDENFAGSFMEPFFNKTTLSDKHLFDKRPSGSP